MANNNDEQEKQKFLYPLSQYRGQFTPQNLVFNANLQEFAQRVAYLCALESNGKLPPEQAYENIKELWHQFKKSKKELLSDETDSD
jgi:hypothetical protein